MIKNLKKLVLYLSLILSSSLFFTNCEKEGLHVEQSQFNIKLAPWEHLKDNNKKLSKKVESHLKKNQLSRLVTSNQYDFYLDDSSVQVIEHEDYTSYTFFVLRDSITSNILENYSYIVYPDETYRQHLLKYFYTTNEIGEKVLDTDVIEITTINDDSLIFTRTGCVPELIDVSTELVCIESNTCFGLGSNGVHTNAGDCACQDTKMSCYPPGSQICNLQTMFNFSSCSGGADTDNSDTNNNANNNSPVGGNTNTPSQEPDTVAIPLDDPSPVWQPVLDCINGLAFTIGQVDNTTIDSTIFEQLNFSHRDWSNINNYLEDNNCNEEVQQEMIDFIEATIPFPHCSSFEYAQPAGESVKACAVTNLNESFYASKLDANGNWGFYNVDVNYPILYFKMPTWMTNGSAATLTASAVNQAFNSTTAWYALNPEATEYQVGLQLDIELTISMQAIGGTMQIIAPFNIPSPAPFVTSLFSTGNCN